MSLLHYTAYSHYANTELLTSNDITGAVPGTFGSSNDVTIAPSGGRNGRGSFRLTSGFYGPGERQYAWKTVTPTSNTAIAGFAYRLTGLGYITRFGVAAFLMNTTYQTYLEVIGSGALVLRSGNSSGTILATSNTCIVNSNYHFIEITTDNAVSGTFTVHVDNNLALSYSGNVQGAGSSDWNTVLYGNQMGVASSGYYVDYSDSYILDGTGSAPYNARLRDVAVESYYPIANGNYTQLSNSAAGNHYTLVDDNPVNDTDYLYGGTIGNRESFVYTLPTGGSILATNMSLYGKKDVAGVRGVKEFVRNSGTNYDNATEISLSSSYRFYNNIRTVNPATSAAWASGNAEFGVVVTS
tara:strand:+ start:2061 stop:3122 length:1062 start_codon:yes stop_codon:yes gene_type:complete